MSCISEDKLKEIFLKADTSRDGKINPTELRDLVRKELLKADMSDRDVADMFCDLDSNHDQEITWEEFKTEMMKAPRRKAFSDMFRELDKDGSNTLTTEECRQLLKRGGCSEEQVVAMFSKVDTNQDGIISFEEFMAMV
ncbi:polcalcin Jun o 2-like [Pecten maximus]|uniref:polcalcin Jun o 2-like n=1 Tax=Pecten maximus TaxID=6579 RepID=UPI001458DC65|nr:polcalcin Jun o 2-like [Pecten maximus]